MPNRILREGILTSERVNSLSWPAEVFYRRLMSAVDDFGRFWAKPDLLRAALYPLQLDKVGNSNVAKWLAECAGAGLVRAYTVEKKEYLQLLDFRQQVRALVSKFPQMPPDAQQTLSTCIAPAHVVGDEDGDEDGGDSTAQQAAPPAKINGVPKDEGPVIAKLPLREGGEFEVRGSFVAEFEAIYPDVDVPRTLLEMRGWCLGNQDRLKTRKGIRRFINHWLQGEQEKHGGQA